MKIKQFTQFSILMLIIISLFTMACNKEKGGVTPNTLRLIDKETVSNGNFYQYTYDANNRCVRVDFKTGYTTYVYSGSIVTETNTPNSGSPTIYTNTLNAQGLVEKRTNVDGSYTYITSYEYNTQGFVTKITDQSGLIGSPLTPSRIRQYNRDADGDYISIVSVVPNSPSSSGNYTTTYVVDKRNYYTTSSEFIGLKWRGKYLVHSILSTITKTVNASDNNISNLITYDAKGYMTQQNVNSSLNGNLIYSYTYK
jgi:hypothetical protein